MKAAQIRQWMEERNIAPRRSWGQSFLLEDKVAASIVDALGLGDTESVLEIGGGFGALTRFLVNREMRTTVMEKDPHLAHYLEEKFASKNLEVLCQDALDADESLFFEREPLTLLGNLPYSVATAILEKYLTPPTPFARAVVMLQREVAQKICAQPRSKEYGALSLLLQVDWEIDYLLTVPPSAFYPRPQVDSAVILLRRRPERQFYPLDRRHFRQIVRSGFSQRRKQLKKNLPLSMVQWDQLAQQLGFSLTARAEELSLHDWVALSRSASGLTGKTGEIQTELLQVVDEQNRPMRGAPRDVIHREGLLHRAVHLWVINARGELYMQFRSLAKSTHPAKWDSSASGHVDVGESYVEAALRELQEELGMKGVLQKVGELPADEENGWEFIELFLVSTRREPRPNPLEIDSGRFFSFEAIASWLQKKPEAFAPGFRQYYQFYQSHRDLFHSIGK